MSDHDNIHQESSASNEDISVHVEEPPLKNETSSGNKNNNCPCLPNSQQKEIAQALFKVPEGFQALLKHITRELLNAKPKDPYIYIAEFLKNKVNDKRRGLLEQEFFNDDTLNIDIKPPMHYLQQTSLANVTCPSTSAFDALASDAATTLQASFRGMQGRGEVQEVKRDPGRQPQFSQLRRNSNTNDKNNFIQDACGKVTTSTVEGCGHNAARHSMQQRKSQGKRPSNQPNRNDSH